MAHSYHHALGSARRYGGVPEDYIRLHSWMDSSKASYADHRHRALLHHATGIWLGQDLFGQTVRNSAGRDVPVRLILEQHVIEDHGFIPTIQQWFHSIRKEPWMSRGAAPVADMVERDLPLPPVPETPTDATTLLLTKVRDALQAVTDGAVHPDHDTILADVTAALTR